jgi:prevent-host-death family protein
MKSTNAIEVRRSLGKVLGRLSRGGGPILVERNGKPAAVLISLDAYRERFADGEASEERQQLLAEILAARDGARRSSKRTAVEAVRALRGPLP